MAIGLMYTARFENVSITDAAQDIWELVTGNASIIVHWIKLSFRPTITAGVAQDVRGRFRILERSTTGSGGQAVTPNGVHPRNTVASLTTCTRTVTTPGTAGDVRWADDLTTMMPIEIVFTADMRQPVQAASGRLCLEMVAGLGAAYNASSTVSFEEL
jgi:hypothetical protein